MGLKIGLRGYNVVDLGALTTILLLLLLKTSNNKLI